MRAWTVGAWAVLAAVAVVTAEAAAGEAASQPIPVARVAVVKIEKLFDDYDYIKDSKVDIENKFRPAQDRIENMRKNFEAQKQAMLNDPLMRPGAPEFKRKQMEIELLQAQIEEEQRKLASDANKENAAVIIRFYDAFRVACVRASQFYQVDILLAATEPTLPEEARKDGVPAPALMQDIVRRMVLYTSGQVDVTQGVLHILNSTYRAHKQNRALPMFPTPPK